MGQIAGRDETLAQLLADLTEQVRRGQQPDLNDVARRHPELAKELRELWAAVQLAEVLAQPSSPPTPTVDLPPIQAAGRECGAFAVSALPGTFGDYDLLEELGRGAMGVVYRAHQRSLDRLVAIKMLLRGDLASEADLARFRGEAEAAARLKHPNVVSVFEVGDGEGQ